MLTKKQHELLLFINRRLGENGISPSFEEMKEALNLKSKSGIHRLISGLEERGFIKRLAHRARALEVVKLPEETAPWLATVSVTESVAPAFTVAALGVTFVMVRSGFKVAKFAVTV